MTELLPLDPDQLLTTTRSVRKRLDLATPVPLHLVREALEVALQAPNGANRQNWHWIVVTDGTKRRAIGDLYSESFAAYISVAGDDDEDAARQATHARVASSAQYLADHLAEVPVLVLGAIDTGLDDFPPGSQAGYWGSLLPAAWSLQLALRARGLGSAWTTFHLQWERQLAELVGIPSTVHVGVLLPVAYTLGTDFRPAPRQPVSEVLHLNEW